MVTSINWFYSFRCKITAFFAYIQKNEYFCALNENVQHFIQDSVNGDFQGWDKETPTFIVEPAAKQVSDTQYIYWDK